MVLEFYYHFVCAKITLTFNVGWQPCICVLCYYCLPAALISVYPVSKQSFLSMCSINFDVQVMSKWYCPNPALAAVFDSMFSDIYLIHVGRSPVMVIRLASSPSPVVCCYPDTSLVCLACHLDFASIILWDLFTSTDIRSFVLLLLAAMFVCTSSVSLALVSELFSIDNA